jgi:hypothetical protein
MSDTRLFYKVIGSHTYPFWEELHGNDNLSSGLLDLQLKQDMLERGKECTRFLDILLSWLQNLPTGYRETKDLLDVERTFNANCCSKDLMWLDEMFVVSETARVRWHRVKNTKSLLLKIELQTLFFFKGEGEPEKAAETTCRIWTDKDFGPWQFKKEPPLDLHPEVTEGEILFMSAPQLSVSTGNFATTGSSANSDANSDNRTSRQTKTVEGALESLVTDYGVSWPELIERAAKLLSLHSQNTGATSMGR